MISRHRCSSYSVSIDNWPMYMSICRKAVSSRLTTVELQVHKPIIRTHQAVTFGDQNPACFEHDRLSHTFDRSFTTAL